jgi:hypothetical protein
VISLDVRFWDVMRRAEPAVLRLFGPDLKDMFVGRESPHGLLPAGMVAGVHEQLQVGPELLVGSVMLALDRGVLDGAVHLLGFSRCLVR